MNTVALQSGVRFKTLNVPRDTMRQGNFPCIQCEMTAHRQNTNPLLSPLGTRLNVIVRNSQQKLTGSRQGSLGSLEIPASFA